MGSIPTWVRLFPVSRKRVCKLALQLTYTTQVLSSFTFHVSTISEWCYVIGFHTLNPFTPNVKFPAEILPNKVWRTWLFMAYSDERWSYYQFSLTHYIHFLFKTWRTSCAFKRQPPCRCSAIQRQNIGRVPNLRSSSSCQQACYSVISPKPCGFLLPFAVNLPVAFQRTPFGHPQQRNSTKMITAVFHIGLHECRSKLELKCFNQLLKQDVQTGSKYSHAWASQVIHDLFEVWKRQPLIRATHRRGRLE